MQRAEDSSSRLAPDPARSGLKPTTAFVLLLLVITAIGALVFLTRPTPAPQPTGTTTATEPNFALTNEQAITRFEELNTQLVSAFENRDVSLLDTFLTADSPLRHRAASEISQLLNDKVVPAPIFESRSIEVILNGPESILIRQVSIDSSRFKSEAGDDLTQNPKNILRVVEWTLEIEDSIWKIASSRPIRSRVLR